MEYSDQAIILHVGRFKESDIWVRLLSPSRGILSAFAFGGSRSRRRFIGCLDLFNHVQFRIQPSRQGEYLCLQEGVLLHGPGRLRSDPTRLGIAMNCAKFLQAFEVTEEGAPQAHVLFTELLRILEEACTLPPLLPLFFRIRMAFDQGYALETRLCGRCGNILDKTAYFFLRHARFLCDTCRKGQPEYSFPLSNTSRSVLAYVAQKPANQWLEAPTLGKDKFEFSRFADAFIQFHVGLSWENGRFLRV